MNKTCTKCQTLKVTSDFVRNKNRPDGFHAWCKACLAAGKKQSYLKKRDIYNAKSKANYRANAAHYKALNKEWRLANKDLMDGYMKKYRQSEKGKLTRREESRRSYHSGYRKAWNGGRRRGIIQATPKWVDKEVLKKIYRERPAGYHVDHIMPLRGKNACGLNVPWNLQYLPASENLRKSNKLLGGTEGLEASDKKPVR